MTFLETLINNKNLLFKSTLETIDMVFSSFLIACLIGIPIAIYLSISKKNNILKIIVSFLTNIIRSIPFMIFVLVITPLTIFIMGKSYGSQAAKVPLTLISIALVIRTTEQSIKLLSNDIFKLAHILGANKVQLTFHFIIKEVLPSLILGLTTVIISIISYSTVMGIVAGGGLGSMALKYGLYEYDFKLLFIIIIILIIITQIIQGTGNLLSFYLNKENYRRTKKRWENYLQQF